MSGAAALIKANDPLALPQQIEWSLMLAADDLDLLNPLYVGDLGAGRLNVANALGAQYGSPLDRLTDLLIRPEH